MSAFVLQLILEKFFKALVHKLYGVHVKTQVKSWVVDRDRLDPGVIATKSLDLQVGIFRIIAFVISMIFGGGCFLILFILLGCG